MFVPVPEAFNGSFTATEQPASRLKSTLSATFTGLSLLSATSAGLIAAHAGWQPCLAWCSLALLVPALAGLCVTGLIEQDPGALIVRLQHAIGQHLAATPHSKAMRRHPDEPALQALAGMIADGVSQLRRLQAGRARMQERARATNRALQAGRDQARQLGCTLMEDGANLADAAAGIMMASARLAEDTAITGASAEGAERHVADAVERAVNLASATRATTAEITGMTRIAVTAAEAAFSAHRSVAALDSKVQSLSSTAEQVGQALQMAAACGRQASTTNTENSRTDTAGHAHDLQAMAAAADRALAAMQAMLAELRSDTGAANSRLSELAELIGRQHDLGFALSHAVQQQGDDIAGLAEHLLESQAGFATLRAGVAAVTRSNTSRLAGAEALRGAANRLPAHADTIAGILRVIPDFSPPLD